MRNPDPQTLALVECCLGFEVELLEAFGLRDYSFSSLRFRC